MQPKNIVVIDDDSDLLDLLDTYLRMQEHNVFCYPTYDYVPRKEADVFVLDLNCPPIRGDYWIKKYGNIVVPEKRILMSAKDDGWEQTGTQGLYLHKPFMLKDLDTLINDVVLRSNE